MDTPDYTLDHSVAQCERCGRSLAEQDPEQVTAAAVAGFDETGVRSDGSLHWLHTVSTEWLTWYFAHRKRGTEALDAAGVLPNFSGRAIHDCWRSYLNYDCDHGFCNAHLLRELTFLWEQQGQRWAADMVTTHLVATGAGGGAGGECLG